MFYQRKDYSLDEIQVLMRIFKDRKLVSLDECFNLINTCQNMTEKSYKDNLNNFINTLTKKELRYFVKNYDIKNYRINIGQIESSKISVFPAHFIFNEIYHTALGYNPDHPLTHVEYNYISNILKSKYKDFLHNILIKNNSTITNAPKNFKLANVKVDYDNQKYISGEQFKKGYIYYKDIKYIIKNKIIFLDISKMKDGYSFRLPYANVFYHFDSDLIKKNIQQILFNGLCSNADKDFYPYLYNMAIGTMVELFDYFKIRLNWKVIKNKTYKFLQLSCII